MALTMGLGGVTAPRNARAAAPSLPASAFMGQRLPAAPRAAVALLPPASRQPLQARAARRGLLAFSSLRENPTPHG